ncbi:MAG: hypothetical protein P1P88_11915 [Bacteroidales bacterium]|nr:hypothetical protein [Bacteroidales bacterium]
MKNCILLLIPILFITSLSNAQTLKEDPYAIFCLNFVRLINSETTIDGLMFNFNPALRNDSLRIKLADFKSEIVRYKSSAHYYLVKFNRPSLFFYNIFIHDPDKKLSFGNLRLVFFNTDDFLIDDWIYFKETDEEIKEEELPVVPLPPQQK